MRPEFGPAYELPPALWVYHNGDVCDGPKVYDVMTREGESAPHPATPQLSNALTNCIGTQAWTVV
eukprot:COSAG01_NODE_39668_length_473_cov_1.355615_1_plen_64_part_10